MLLREFVDNYYLHDSFFEKISYDEQRQSVELTINFAFWMQSDYKISDPETGIIKVIFNDVTEFVCSDDIDINAVSILKTDLYNNTVKFLIMNDITDNSLEMYITASSVNVIKT